MTDAVWTTKDGRRLPIVEMTDSHLANTILFLRRAAARYQDSVLTHPPHFEGEMAQYYAEQEWVETASCSLEDLAKSLYPIYADLLREHNRRMALRKPGATSA